MIELAYRVGGFSSTISNEPTEGVEPDHTPASAAGVAADQSIDAGLHSQQMLL